MARRPRTTDPYELRCEALEHLWRAFERVMKAKEALLAAKCDVWSRCVCAELLISNARKCLQAENDGDNTMLALTVRESSGRAPWPTSRSREDVAAQPGTEG